MDNILLEELNSQLNKELQSAYIYLGIAAYFKQISMDGFYKTIVEQAKEETDHAKRIFDYLLSLDAEVKLSDIQKADTTWKSPKEAIKFALEHEKYITNSIHSLYEKAKELKDARCEVFLQWYVKEQIEEEEKFRGLLDKLENVQKYECEVLHLDNFLEK